MIIKINPIQDIRSFGFEMYKYWVQVTVNLKKIRRVIVSFKDKNPDLNKASLCFCIENVVLLETGYQYSIKNDNLRLQWESTYEPQIVEQDIFRINSEYIESFARQSLSPDKDTYKFGLTTDDETDRVRLSVN